VSGCGVPVGRRGMFVLKHLNDGQSLQFMPDLAGRTLQFMMRASLCRTVSPGNNIRPRNTGISLYVLLEISVLFWRRQININRGRWIF
jgi:hypothetical protein